MVGVEVARRTAELGRHGDGVQHGQLLSSRSTKTMNSFPSEVGDAGCPCVRASIGTPRHSSAMAASLSRTSSTAG